MNLKNFTIEPSFSEISYGPITIDLHNEYLWMKTAKNDEVIKLIFEKRVEKWTNRYMPEWFCLKIDGVTGIWEKEEDKDYPHEYLNADINTPDLFGFSYSGDESMKGPTDFKRSNDNLVALILTTVTGKTLKVEGKSAEIIEMKKQ